MTAAIHPNQRAPRPIAQSLTLLQLTLSVAFQSYSNPSGRHAGLPLRTHPPIPSPARGRADTPVCPYASTHSRQGRQTGLPLRPLRHAILKTLVSCCCHADCPTDHPTDSVCQRQLLGHVPRGAGVPRQGQPGGCPRLRRRWVDPAGGGHLSQHLRDRLRGVLCL